jgi:hypothetical protein
MTKKKLRHRILRGHNKGCVALAETKRRVWGTPWAYLRAVEYRDSVGRLRKDMSGSRWWRIGCNHIGCKAEIAVCERDILEHLPHE